MSNVGPLNDVLTQAFKRLGPGNTEIQIVDFFDRSYVSGTQSVNAAGETAARVGGSNLANRKLLVIHNLSSGNIFFGATGFTASTSTAAHLQKNNMLILSMGPNLTVFLRRSTGTGTVYIEEFA